MCGVSYNVRDDIYNNYRYTINFDIISSRICTIQKARIFITIKKIKIKKTMTMKEARQDEVEKISVFCKRNA